MIYLNTKHGQHIVILEQGNLDALKNGGLEKTPNRSVLIAYTPDVPWLQDQIIKHLDDLTPELLERIIKESQQHPVVKDRSYHPTLKITPGKTQTD